MIGINEGYKCIVVGLGKGDVGIGWGRTGKDVPFISFSDLGHKYDIGEDVLDKVPEDYIPIYVLVETLESLDILQRRVDSVREHLKKKLEAGR